VNGRSWGGDGAAAHLHGFGSGSIDPVLVRFDCFILVFSCWSVLGTNRWFCAWYNSCDLCLVQFTQSVPGTIHSICAWHNTPDLCLAQFTQSVPGTTHPICSWHKYTQSVPCTKTYYYAWHNSKYENALLFPLTTCIYMNRIIVYLVYTTGPLNDVSGYY
jgi:hypothetical protein